MCDRPLAVVCFGAGGVSFIGDGGSLSIVMVIVSSCVELVRWYRAVECGLLSWLLGCVSLCLNHGVVC